LKQVATLEKFKETKGTVVYEHPDQGRAVVDRVYVHKFYLPKMEPQRVAMLITDEFTEQEILTALDMYIKHRAANSATPARTGTV